MSATLVSNPWPLAAPQALPFGRQFVAAGAQGQAQAVQWLMTRPVFAAPRQWLLAVAGLSAASALIAAGLHTQGLGFAPAFLVAELALLVVALLLVARHAADREQLTLVGRSLLVEQTLGGRTERAGWQADMLRVEPQAAQGSLVQLSGAGRTLRVGRFLRPELRGAFAHELRQALRQARAGHPFKPTEY